MEEISKKTGKPSKNYTNSQWQEDFSRIKSEVNPSTSKIMKIIPEHYNHNNTYHGMTQYQYYCGFINDILRHIRKGKSDYCYCVYQIAELLKYEHDRLKADWLEDELCFKVKLISSLE